MEIQGLKCHATIFQADSKQDFVNHVHDLHVEAEEYFCKIEDGSLSDIFCPWEEDTKGIFLWWQKKNPTCNDNSFYFYIGIVTIGIYDCKYRLWQKYSFKIILKEAFS